MSAKNLHNLHNLLNFSLFCSLRAMEVFGASELILPYVHCRERQKPYQRLLAYKQAIAGLA